MKNGQPKGVKSIDFRGYLKTKEQHEYYKKRQEEDSKRPEMEMYSNFQIDGHHMGINCFVGVII